MRAVRMSEGCSTAGAGLKLLARFGLVGIAATMLYAVLAIGLVESKWIGFSPVQASLAAYAAAAVFSYLAHKSVTFMSSGSHRSEAARFLLLTATGFAVAYAAPALLTAKLGLPPIVTILVTCLLIPAVNLLMLDRWVFAQRGPSRQGDR
ncbi:MAG: GtrA family protein [Mesorhizobium sp.]|uniref:GtrA family protein n=1 Tax=Mesorhizobium sp. TaxID=1871066 RepID=UPI000FE8757F|nr:GtrA family protein [Mesorhizobium sp.]RWM16024.1 MAG: GtrA family protein [Mesorhizobium sp.]TIP73266.1 MAG: GtrA family protein [Mesorhizobium sp.]TIQ11400.1 MAG: GtrA family protein [Mesorhizobium sp.]TIR50980.1 MAG: GtrA family protein [Mesorhizobium sp.]TJV97300.1 MAG: GtrA family protein [Mesorhizobium sp.]